jgi:hypothetical protein
MFPVRCRVVRALGEGELEATLKKTSSDLNDAIVTAVVKQAAYSTGIQIALMFAGPLGLAISGLASLVQMIAGKYYQKQMQDVINDTMDAIKNRGTAMEARLTAEGQTVFMQELPAGRALAMSNTPLEGLGENIFERAVRNVSKVPGDVWRVVTSPTKTLKIVGDIYTAGARPIAKALLNVPLAVAKRAEYVGVAKEGTLTKPLLTIRETTNDVLTSAGRFLSPISVVQESVGLTAKWGGQAVAAGMKATGNEKGAAEVLRVTEGIHQGAQGTMTAFTPAGSYNLISGREGLLAARDACERMRGQAFAQMDKMTSEGIAKLQSPTCREQMRIGIAKALRQDPAFIEQMQRLREIEEQERLAQAAQIASLKQDVASLPPVAAPASSGAGTAVGLAAAVAAAIAFTR